MWKQLVEAQWLGGRVLCQHNILGHVMPNSFLHVFRRHKALLSVDPATQRGLLPSALTLWMPNAEQEYSMLVELSYSARRVTKNKLVRCLESRQKTRLVDQEYSMISPPLSLDSRLSWVLGCLRKLPGAPGSFRGPPESSRERPGAAVSASEGLI